MWVAGGCCLLFLLTSRLYTLKVLECFLHLVLILSVLYIAFSPLFSPCLSFSSSVMVGSICYRSCDSMTHVYVYIRDAWWLCSDCAKLPSSEPPVASEKLPATMMPGGLSETKPATPEVQHIVNQVSCDLSKDEFSLCKGLSPEAWVKAGRPGDDTEPVFKLKKLVLKMGISLIASKYLLSVLHRQRTGKTETNHFSVSSLSVARHSTGCLRFMFTCSSKTSSTMPALRSLVWN